MSARPGMRYFPVPSIALNVSGTGTTSRCPRPTMLPPETSTVWSASAAVSPAIDKTLTPTKAVSWIAGVGG